MANGQKTYPGVIALSRDLERDLQVKFGDIIEIEGVGSFVYQDRMPKKWNRRVDIWFKTSKECFNFGVQRRQLWKKQK
jgi:3D (Asp-Asp-Asp) domain-containing protein